MGHFTVSLVSLEPDVDETGGGTNPLNGFEYLAYTFGGVLDYQHRNQGSFVFTDGEQALKFIQALATTQFKHCNAKLV